MFKSVFWSENCNVWIKETSMGWNQKYFSLQRLQLLNTSNMSTLNLCGCKIWMQSLKENTLILSYGRSNKIQRCWTFINDLSIHKKLGVSEESCNKLAYEFIYYPSWGKKPKVKPFKLGEYFTNLFPVQWSRSLHGLAVILCSTRTASCPSWVTYIAYQQSDVDSHIHIYQKSKSPGQWCFSPPKLHLEFYANLTGKNETICKASENVIMNFLILQCQKKNLERGNEHIKSLCKQKNQHLFFKWGKPFQPTFQVIGDFVIL